MDRVLHILDNKQAQIMSRRQFVESDLFTKREVKLKEENAKPEASSDDIKIV